MPCRTLLVAFFLPIALALAAEPPAAPEEPSPDEQLLTGAGVAVDGDGLLMFFRRRTLSDAEVKQVHGLIRQLGAGAFEDRESASEALRKLGDRAAPLVWAAAHDPDGDPEVVRRACDYLREVEAPPPLRARAAARLLAHRAPADAVPVLLAYLPAVADPAVEDEVLAALLALTPAGKADPALAAALDDPLAVRRAAAAHVLGRKGDKEQQAAVGKRLGDDDPGVRWRAAMSLLAAHDKAGVTGLLSLLTDGPLDMGWRTEDILRRLVGDKAPAVSFDESPILRRKCRDAWAAWWKENGDGVDLAPSEEGAPLWGYTLGVEYNTGRVWECNPDGSVRWEIHDLAGPMDAQVLPNGHVLIAEADAHAVTERDFKGAVLWEKKIDGEPIGCQRLPGGSTFVSTCRRAMEFAADGATVYSIKLETGVGGANAVRKGRDGYVISTGDGWLTELDTAGKRVCAVRLPVRGTMYVGVEELPGDRFLVADSRQGRVLEVDGDGKVLWQADVPAACGVERLSNGHTLVSTNHKVIELDAFGKQVWEKGAEGYVRRVHRR